MTIALTSSWESHYFLIISGVLESLGERLLLITRFFWRKRCWSYNEVAKLWSESKGYFCCCCCYEREIKTCHLHPSIKAPIYIKDIKLIPIQFKDWTFEKVFMTFWVLFTLSQGNGKNNRNLIGHYKEKFFNEYSSWHYLVDLEGWENWFLSFFFYYFCHLTHVSTIPIKRIA